MQRLSPMILALLAGAFTIDSASADPRFRGTVRYKLLPDCNAVQLDADAIVNTCLEDATGTLQMQLWATHAPYSGGKFCGTVLASTKLEGLRAGNMYDELCKRLTYTAPAEGGCYYMTVALLEYRNGGYNVVDYVNMPSKATLAPAVKFKMQGPVEYVASYEGGTVEINVPKISYNSDCMSGPLKVSVWLTDEPYSGGRIVGYEIGAVEKQALRPGYAYEAMRNVAKFSPPPDGKYYPNLILSQWDGSAYKVVASIPGNERVCFRREAAEPEPRYDRLHADRGEARRVPSYDPHDHSAYPDRDARPSRYREPEPRAYEGNKYYTAQPSRDLNVRRANIVAYSSRSSRTLPGYSE